MRHRASPTIRAALLAALLVLPIATSRLAQGEDAPRTAPPVPIDPAQAEVARALRDAKKELEAAQSQADKEARELQAKIAEETKAVLALHDQEKKLSEKLQQSETESRSLDEKLAAAAALRKKATTSLEAARAELEAQASRFAERLAGSLVTAQDEQILEAVTEIRSGKSQALSEQLKVFLELYNRMLGYSRTAAMVQRAVRMPAAGDRIENLKVLRLGLLGGYFSSAATRSGGFVLADPGSKAGFVAESRGLAKSRQAAIAAILQKPDKGGVLPVDVTGGEAIAALGTSESLADWFARGGIWMWPILAIAAAAALLALERGLSISIKRLGIGQKVKRALVLVRSGRAEAAAAEASKGKDPTSRVLNAILQHRENGRDALEAAMDEALLRQSTTIDARLGLLSLAASIAPLIGILGTVTGLFATFKLLSVVGPDGHSILTGGLSESLITTEAALYVAVPCLVLRGVLGALGDGVKAKLESGALAVMVALLENEEAPLEVVGEPA